MLINQKTMAKIGLIEERYNKLRYAKVMDVPCEMWETYEHYNHEPLEAEGANWKAAPKGTKWGDNWRSAWFRCDVKFDIVPAKKIFIKANTDGETLFIVDESFKGVFDDNHPVVAMTLDASAEKNYHLAFEAYAGHHKPGCGPDETDPAPTEGCKTFGGVEVLIEREDVSGFVFDLKVLRQLQEILGEDSLRKNKIAKGLCKVFELVDAKPEEQVEESWRPKLKKAREIMKPLLECVNGSTAPQFGIVGHSHIDTAWLWTIAETKRKCARTFSSVLNLMEQYPEFNFVQSSPCQTEMIRERYPEIYARIKKKVEEGRWEPNGAMWLEPDCNIPSGESLVRQLLVGQNTTREMFGYTADTLWLPDVFGYSATLPQLLRGANVKFFCTTKLDWNDTNRFPYDTFVWKGIDGSSVVSHLHNLHCWADPETMDKQWKHVQHKDVQDRRLIAIGYGDGGGGPMAEMIEVSRRVKDLEGCPKAEYTSVSDFMNGVEEELLEDLPVWNGELYLELHRGTLTSLSGIKRGNRKCEVALRDAELLCTIAALNGNEYPKKELLHAWKILLLNQFHDILPGSSIAKVNDEAMEAFAKCLNEAQTLSGNALKSIAAYENKNKTYALVINNLSWNRAGEISLGDAPEGSYPEDETIAAQWIKGVDGNSKLLISGVEVPALGAKTIAMTEKRHETKSSFKVEADEIETPHATIKLDVMGRIVSLIDKKSGREIVKNNGLLNAFYLGEDIPGFWDSWDIDRDYMLKMQIENGFISSEIVADGPIQLRIRNHYKIGAESSMVQDMIFHKDSAQIDFETKLEWKEKHKLLKVGFDVDVLADNAKHEIQYGYVERATHENLSVDRARFESCNHKWTDLSENEFGVAILNDCKYGVSVRENSIQLSLMKSGLRPDTRGDEGTHYFTYSVLPHDCGFSVESVVRPAYELNIPAICAKTSKETAGSNSLLEIDASNIIVESIKWAENDEGFVVRIYDAGRVRKNVNIKFNVPVKEVIETNILEEEISKVSVNNNNIALSMRPFEVKTLLCKM